jgi:hypothetical protein
MTDFLVEALCSMMEDCYLDAAQTLRCACVAV